MPMFGDIVVVLPGITGSVLERDGREVWSLSPRGIFEGVRTLGGSLRNLALTHGDDPNAETLDDGVEATRLMPDLHLLPGLDWKIDGYGRIVSHLTQRFQLVEGQNLRSFPYDWRRDNRASAHRLRTLSRDWLDSWRESSGNDNAKLVLVAHSMGGLVSRYFVECLEGWKDTRAVITIATPFYGSLNAVDFLTHGMRKGFGIFKVDLGPLLSTFTSVQQLVPVYKCVQQANGEMSTPSTAGLPNWRDGWRNALDDFYSEMETKATENRKDALWEQHGTRYIPIVGTDQPTRQSAILAADGTVTIDKTFAGKDRGGDGTVPRISAALSGTEDTRMFGAERHASLQNLEAVLVQLSSVIESFDELHIDDVRSALLSWFAFDADEMYASQEPISVEVSMVTDLPEWQLPDLSATVTVTNRDTGETVKQFEQTVSRAPTAVDLGQLEPGAYAIAISPPVGTDSGSIHDVILVVDADDDPEA